MSDYSPSKKAKDYIQDNSRSLRSVRGQFEDVNQRNDNFLSFSNLTVEIAAKAEVYERNVTETLISKNNSSYIGDFQQNQGDFRTNWQKINTYQDYMTYQFRNNFINSYVNQKILSKNAVIGTSNSTKSRETTSLGNRLTRSDFHQRAVVNKDTENSMIYEDDTKYSGDFGNYQGVFQKYKTILQDKFLSTNFSDFKEYALKDSNNNVIYTFNFDDEIKQNSDKEYMIRIVLDFNYLGAGTFTEEFKNLTRKTYVEEKPTSVQKTNFVTQSNGTISKNNAHSNLDQSLKLYSFLAEQEPANTDVTITDIELESKNNKKLWDVSIENEKKKENDLIQTIITLSIKENLRNI